MDGERVPRDEEDAWRNATRALSIESTHQKLRRLDIEKMQDYQPLKARPHVAVIDSPQVGHAYEHLDECDFEVMAVVPEVSQANLALLHEYDVVLVGCAQAELRDPSMQADLARVTRMARAVAVVPGGESAPLAARLGFQGFVAREAGPEALTRTVKAVAGGEAAFPRATLGALLRMFSLMPPPNQETTAMLTARQHEIVELIAEGATDREIAARLNISESTAHKHVQNALRRSNTKTRSQLVAVARQSPNGI